MPTIGQLLDKVHSHGVLENDSAIAEHFGIRRQAVSKWRNGEAWPSQDHITKLAALAGEDPAMWLVVVQAERAEGDERPYWERLARKLGAAATVAAVALLFPFATRATDLSANLNQRSADALCEVSYVAGNTWKAPHPRKNRQNTPQA